MASTIKDVARRAGVSTATVSLVLSERPGVRISEATRQRVREAANELEFTPNILARSLISGKSEMLGLVVDDISAPFIVGVIEGVERAARERRHHVIICQAKDAEEEMDTIRWLRSRAVDGIIMASGLMHGAAITEYLERERLPLVLVNQQAEGVAASVAPDHRAVGREAARLFLDAGYQKLGYLGYSPSDANTLRLEGFREEAEKRGKKVEVAADDSAKGREELAAAGQTQGAKLLKAGCDAVLAFNDFMALGFLEAARAAGKSVPQDVALIGVDNLPCGAVTAPGLASFELNLVETGRRAAESLLNPDNRPEGLVAPTFCYRASAGKAGK